nr:MAG: hypothetical protein H1Rhizo26FD989_000003 [Mitovirus sp.]
MGQTNTVVTSSLLGKPGQTAKVVTRRYEGMLDKSKIWLKFYRSFSGLMNRPAP